MIDQLRTLGVDFAQGHLIGSPVPAAEIVEPDTA
jgi:EAL domain-containing protein (putative c-di-GMP-specific phosphodiesterase class I)